MSILITPKGWAIEIEPIHATGKEVSNLDLAGSYESILKSLVETISTAAQSTDGIPPEYPVFELLESMLPDSDNARAMFADLRAKQA